MAMNSELKRQLNNEITWQVSGFTIKVDGTGSVFINFLDNGVQIFGSQLVVQFVQNVSQYFGGDVTVAFTKR